MNNKIVFNNIVVVLFFSFVTSCSASDFEVPIFADAKNIQRDKSVKSSTQKVIYTVSQPYPASEVIAFYDKLMLEKGFVLYLEDGYGDRRWKLFDQKTIQYQPISEPPGIFVSSWVDKAQKNQAILALSYQSDDKNNLTITFGVQPFFEQLEGAGDSTKFNSILEEFTLSDGEFDYESALRKYPQNTWLNKYVQLIYHIAPEYE